MASQGGARWKIMLSVSLAVLVLASGLMIGCSESKPLAPNVKEITVAMMADFSARIAASTQGSSKGILGCIRYLNEVEGGIDVGNGNKVRIRWIERDHKYDMPTATALYRELVQKEDPALIFWYVESTIMGVVDELQENKTPVMMTTAFDPALYQPAGSGWIFCCRSDIDMVTGFYKWVLSDWNGTEKPKVGMLIMDSSWGYGKRDTYDWARNQGIDIVERTYGWDSLDFTSHLLAFKDAGVDYIFADVVAQQASLVIRDSRALELLNNTKIVLGPNFRSAELLAMTKDVDGFLMMNYDCPQECWTGEGREQYDKMANWAGYEIKTDGRTEFLVYCLLKDVVKKAVESAGFDNLDGQAIFDALNNAGTVETYGWNMVTYGPSKHVSPDAARISRLTPDGCVCLTDWITLARITEGVE